MSEPNATNDGRLGRYSGYDRITGLICWLLIALASWYATLHQLGQPNISVLGVACLALCCYRAVAANFLPRGQFKGAFDLLLLHLFVVTICWVTGKSASPFLPVLYLVLMITSLTMGTRITYLMAGLSIASFTILALVQGPMAGVGLMERIVELFPFVMTAHLGALISGQAEAARLEVEKLSLTDDLTDLHNMRSFETLAGQQEKISKRYERPYAICMIDSDNLKQVNDRYGHLAGTALIRWTAHIITENIRECDIAARFGGDEFIVMYEGHDKEKILPAVERIVKAMATSPFTFEGHLVETTLSAGVASFPDDGYDLRTVIMRADLAMYSSKRLGKNRVTLFEGDGAAKRGYPGLQIGGEQFGGAVAQFRRKGAAIHLDEGDLAGSGQGGGAAGFEHPGKG